MTHFLDHSPFHLLLLCLDWIFTNEKKDITSDCRCNKSVYEYFEQQILNVDFFCLFVYICAFNPFKLTNYATCCHYLVSAFGVLVGPKMKS